MKWRTVRSVPKHQRVLVWDGGQMYVAAFTFIGKTMDWVVLTTHEETIIPRQKPTHWQELPGAPLKGVK